MLVISKKSEVTELFFSEADLQELGLSQREAVELGLSETNLQPYDHTWLEYIGAYA